MDFETDFLEDSTNNEEQQGAEYDPSIHFSSSENMDELDDESVHLIVTSPPYNTDWEYGSHDDDMDYATEYIPMLARVFTECYRVLVPGGRMVVNVPSLLRDGREGGFAIASDIEVMLNDRTNPYLMKYDDEHTGVAKLRARCDWKIREWITWSKGYNTDGMSPNGSYPKPWGILMNIMHEVCMVFQKPGKRDVSEVPDQIKEDSEIDMQNDDLCDDVWSINPDSWDFDDDEENVPVFPDELPRRCIKIWSFQGDTVLDPFGGRGTTCKVAKEMNRHSIMYEKREQLRDEIEDYIGVGQHKLEDWG